MLRAMAEITIPANSFGKVRLPRQKGYAVTENGTPLAAGSNGVKTMKYGADHVSLGLGSGVYTLHIGRSTDNAIDNP